MMISLRPGNDITMAWYLSNGILWAHYIILLLVLFPLVGWWSGSLFYPLLSPHTQTFHTTNTWQFLYYYTQSQSQSSICFKNDSPLPHKIFKKEKCSVFLVIILNSWIPLTIFLFLFTPFDNESFFIEVPYPSIAVAYVAPFSNGDYNYFQK